MEVLNNTKKTLNQDNRSTGRDLTPGPPECEAAVLTTLPQRSVYFHFKMLFVAIFLFYALYVYLCVRGKVSI
jgi:hypothetical protein